MFSSMAILAAKAAFYNLEQAALGQQTHLLHPKGI